MPTKTTRPKLFKPFITPRLSSVGEFEAFIKQVFDETKKIKKKNKPWDPGHPLTDVNALPHGIWSAIALHTDSKTLKQNILRIKEKYAEVKAEAGCATLVARTSLRESTDEWCDAGHFSVSISMGSIVYETHLRYDRRWKNGGYVRPVKGRPQYAWIEEIDNPPPGVGMKPGRSHYPALAELGPFDLPNAFSALMLAEFAHHGSSGYYGYGLPKPGYEGQATCYMWCCDICFAGGKALAGSYVAGNRASPEIKRALDGLRAVGYRPIGDRLRLFRNPFALTQGDDLKLRYKNVYTGASDFIVGMPDQPDIMGKESDRSSLKVMLYPLPWEKIRANCARKQFPNVNKIEAAVFDLDKTLIGVDSTEEFAKYLIQEGLFPEQLLPKVVELRKKYADGTIHPDDQPKLIAEVLTSLEQNKVNVLQTIDKFVWNTDFKVRTVVHDMIAAHRLLGHRVIIASASIWLLVSRVVKRCFPGLVLDEDDELLGAILKFNNKNGSFSLDEACGGEKKLERVKMLLASDGIEHFAAYSDSINDLPLLAGSDFPMVVSPDKKLGKHALENRWPIMLLPGDTQRLTSSHSKL